jgi:catalase (peroxidase I)
LGLVPYDPLRYIGSFSNRYRYRDVTRAGDDAQDSNQDKFVNDFVAALSEGMDADRFHLR